MLKFALFLDSYIIFSITFSIFTIDTDDHLLLMNVLLKGFVQLIFYHQGMLCRVIQTLKLWMSALLGCFLTYEI